MKSTLKLKSQILGTVGIALICAGIACNEEKSSKKGNNATAGSASGTGTGNSAANRPAVGSTASAQATPIPTSGCFSGFDGKNNFSLLMPPSRAGYTVADPTIAKVEVVKYTFSQEMIDTLIGEFVKANPDVDSACFKRFIGREQSIHKLTPLKAGVTKIAVKDGRGQFRGNGSCVSSNGDTNLTVTAYTPEQYDLGQKRYNTDAGGNLKACKSCHETATEEKAPPHELGRVMSYNDFNLRTWIKTGQRTDPAPYKARITHKWEFSDENEESGVIAYLRAKQSHDIEQYLKMYMEFQLNNPENAPDRQTAVRNIGKGCGGPNAQGTSTSTSK